MDNLHTLQPDIQENHTIYIDYMKALDSVEQEAVLKSLRHKELMNISQDSARTFI